MNRIGKSVVLVVFASILQACGTSEVIDKRKYIEDVDAQSLISQYPELKDISYDTLAMVTKDHMVKSSLEDDIGCELESGSILFLENLEETRDGKSKYSHLRAVLLKNGNLLASCQLSPAYLDTASIQIRNSGDLQVETVMDQLDAPDFDLSAEILSLTANGRWGIDARIVYPGNRAEVLKQVSAEDKMRPASVTKVVTAFAACEAIAEYCQASTKRYNTLKRNMKSSHNATFSSIFRGIGGQARVREVLQDAGISRANQYRFVDGSGLSYENTLSAQSLTDLLVIAKQRKYDLEFRETFAKPGETGTMKNRLTDFPYNIYGKTGTLPKGRTAALSGYVELPRKAFLVFTVIANDVNASVGHRHIDSILKVLTEHAAYQASLNRNNA